MTINIKTAQNFQVAAPRRFSLVCFRLVSAQNNVDCNQLNRELLEAVNSTGKLFMSHTVYAQITSHTFLADSNSWIIHLQIAFSISIKLSLNILFFINT